MVWTVRAELKGGKRCVIVEAALDRAVDSLPEYTSDTRLSYFEPSCEGSEGGGVGCAAAGGGSAGIACRNAITCFRSESDHEEAPDSWQLPGTSGKVTFPPAVSSAANAASLDAALNL